MPNSSVNKSKQSALSQLQDQSLGIYALFTSLGAIMFPLNSVSLLLIALQLLPRTVALQADLQRSNDSLHAPNIGLTNPDFINTTIPSADDLKIPDLIFQSDLLVNGGYNVAWQARP
jgi:hypothetical protein